MKRKILIVDDSAINRLLMKTILETDYEVLEAANGLVAYNIVKQERGRLSAILLDLNMPIMSGYELLDKIKAVPEYSSVPVVVITGSVSKTDGTEEKVLEAGAMDFVVKPCNPIILRNRLHNIIKFGEQAAIANETRMDVLSELYNSRDVFEQTKEMIYERMFALGKEEDSENKDNNGSKELWNPQSIDSLIFNSFVGGACVFEFNNGVIRYLKVNEKYVKIMLGDSEYSEQALSMVWKNRFTEQSLKESNDSLRRAIETGEELTIESELKGIDPPDRSVYIRSVLRVIASSGNRHLFYCVIEDITAAMESELHEKHVMQQLQTILKEMNNGVVACHYRDDNNAIMYFANDRFYEQRGYTREQYENEVKDVRDIICEEDRPLLRDQRILAGEGKVVDRIIYRVRKRDGTIASMRSAISSFIQSESNEPYQIFITEDITTELEARIKERENLELTRLIIDNVASGVTAVTLDGSDVKYLFSNDNYFSMLGYTKEQYFAEVSDTFQIFHPDDRQIIYDAVHRLKPGDKPLVLEYRVFRRDKSIIKVRMVIVSKEYRNNQVLQLSVFEDITEEYREEEHQKELLENLPCGAGIFEVVNGDIITKYLNKKYWELVGRQPEVDGDSSALRFVHEGDRPYLREVIQNIIATGKEKECEVRIVNGDGHYVPFVIRTSVIKYKSGKISLYSTYTSIAEDAITFRQMLPVALETMMSSSEDLSFIKDRSLTYVCASRAFAKLVGLNDEKEIIGKTDYDIFEKEIADKYNALAVEVLNSGNSIVGSIQNLSINNSAPRYFNNSFFLLKDALGNAIGIYGTGRDITDDREAFKRLQILTDTMPGGLVNYTIQRDRIRAQYVSDGVYRIIGYSKEEYDLENDNPLSFVYEKDRNELREKIEGIVLNGEPVDYDCRIERKDGVLRWINLRGIVSERTEDTVTVSTVIFDITEKKLAEIKLNQLEQDNRTKYEHELQLRKSLVQDAFIYYQVNLTNGLLEEYSTTGEKIVEAKVGEPFLEIQNKSIASKIYPGDLERVRDSIFIDALKKAYSKGTTFISEVYRRKISGDDYCWVQMDVHMMEKPGNGDLAVFYQGRNIDHEKKTSLSINTIINEDIESVINVHITKDTAEVVHMRENVNFHKLYGEFDYNKVAEEYCNNFVAKEDREMYASFFNKKNLVKRLKSERMISLSYRLTENNKLRRKTTNAYYLDELKDIIVLTRRDTTGLYLEEMRRQAELKSAVNNANRANKAKTDFISHLSHDMRTPLNAILSFSSGILLENADEIKMQEYLRKINVAGEYMLGIVNDVLDMSRIEQDRIKLNAEPYLVKDFEDTIHGVIDELSKDKNIEFIMDTSKNGSPGIVVDHVRFNQIFINLLSNAVKFTPNGGKVEFILEELGKNSAGKVVKRFTVRDNGIGMSEDFIPRAFDSFQQEERSELSRNTTGTGLGLAIVRELVRMMNGTIQLTSKLNEGTTFIIELPFEETDLFEKQCDKLTHNYEKLKGCRILLAEDVEVNAEIAKALFNKRGSIVEHADNGKKACEMFDRSAEGYYDLILMDIKMPVLDGLSATKRIRAMKRSDAKTVPIIAMTADAFVEDEKIAFDSGMNGHVSKPIVPSRMFDTCCELLES